MGPLREQLLDSQIGVPFSAERLKPRKSIRSFEFLFLLDFITTPKFYPYIHILIYRYTQSPTPM